MKLEQKNAMDSGLMMSDGFTTSGDEVCGLTTPRLRRTPPTEGNCPALRFPEFSEEWVEKTLGEIATIKSGSTPLRSNHLFFDGGTIKWVKTTDLNNTFIFDTEEKITSLAKARINPINTVLVAMYGGFNQIGRTGLLRVPAATNQAISVLNAYEDKVLPLYLLTWLNAKVDTWRMFAGSSRKDPNITGSDVAAFPIKFPSPPEQTKIAAFLSAVDTKIDQLTQKKALLETYKKGAMQQIFSQQIRFKADYGGEYPEWEVKKLGEVLTIGSGRDYKHLTSGDVPVYGTGGYMLSVNDYLYDGESVCIGRKGTIDKPVLVTGKFWTVDTLFYTHSFVNVLPKFIYSCFQLINWKLYNEASGVPSLSKTTIERIEISIPSLPEQTKIANFLSAIDQKIDLLSQQLEQAKAFKKGLLQQMFV